MFQDNAEECLSSWQNFFFLVPNPVQKYHSVTQNPVEIILCILFMTLFLVFMSPVCLCVAVNRLKCSILRRGDWAPVSLCGVTHGHM